MFAHGSEQLRPTQDAIGWIPRGSNRFSLGYLPGGIAETFIEVLLGRDDEPF